MGLSKGDADKVSSPGYLIFGKWKVPESLNQARVEAIKKPGETEKGQKQDANTKKSYQIMYRRLKNDQEVLIVKSAVPKNYFTFVFACIPHTWSNFYSTAKNAKTAASVGLKTNKCLLQNAMSTRQITSVYICYPNVQICIVCLE